MPGKKNELSDREHWLRRTHRKRRLHSVEDSCYKKYFRKYLPIDARKTCIEIGAVPGDQLIYLAKFHKYHPTGIDYIDELGFVGENLKYNGISKFVLIKEDFLQWQPERQYDIVCSFGFIEHFANYREVIQKHMCLVREGGYLVLSVPCLQYFQLWLRKRVYTKEYFEQINLMHNRDIMNLARLEGLIASRGNFSKVFSGYIRRMSIWFEATDSGVKKNRVYFLRTLKLLAKIIGRWGFSHKLISPEILVIYQKTGRPQERSSGCRRQIC